MCAQVFSTEPGEDLPATRRVARGLDRNPDTRGSWRFCPRGIQTGPSRITYHYTNEEDGKTLRRDWTNACQGCALKGQCTTGKERRISRWEHEAVLEAVQARLDRNPAKMRERRQTVEHPFGTIKSWVRATPFQMKTLNPIGTERSPNIPA